MSETATTKLTEKDKPVTVFNQHSLSSTKKLVILFSILFILATGFVILYTNTPNLTPIEKKTITKVPATVKEVQLLRKTLQDISEKHTAYVYFLICYIYILVGSLGLPGVGPLIMVCASLFGGIRTFIICCFCSTVGAAFCYWISYTLVGKVITKLFPKKVESLQQKVQRNQNNLIWFMLFARVTPVLPKWLVSLVSPLIGVPFKVYCIGTILGYIPMNAIVIRMGLTLSQLDQLGMNLESFVTLFILGIVTLIPIKLRKTLEKKIE